MTDYYVDASALVKRYTDEAGSTWMRQITDPSTQQTILLAEITLAEVAAALAAKHRAPGGIIREQRDRILLMLPDFVVNPRTKKRAGMNVPKSATLWSDEQHRGREATTIPWPQAYLRALCE